MPFDRQSYLYIPHQEDQSLLRRKLLHFRLNQILNEANTQEIEASDVFEISNNHYQMNEKEIKEYNQLRASCAELIISFKDHLEIYFVPTGIDREVALKQIAIVPDIGGAFFWKENTPEKLLKGNKYYLLSTTLSEVKNNDIYFSSNKISLGDNYQNKEFTFAPNQQVVLDFDTQYLEKQVAIATRVGSRIKCTKDVNEAGLCYECNYKIEALTGGLFNREFKVEEINLSIAIDGKVFSLLELGATIVSKTHIKVVLDLKKLATQDLVHITILNSLIKQITKDVSGFDFSDSCSWRIAKSSLDLTPVINKSLEMQIKGSVFDF